MVRDAGYVVGHYRCCLGVHPSESRVYDSELFVGSLAQLLPLLSLKPRLCVLACCLRASVVSRNVLGEDLLAVGSFGELMEVFTPFAERGGVLREVAGLRLNAVVVVVSLVVVVLGLVGVEAGETEICCLAPFLVPILLNLKLIQVCKHCFKGDDLLPDLVLAEEVLVALLNGVQQHYREEAVANSLH